MAASWLGVFARESSISHLDSHVCMHFAASYTTTTYIVRQITSATTPLHGQLGVFVGHLVQRFVDRVSTYYTRLLGILQPASRFGVALLAEASSPNFIQLNPTCPVVYCIVFPPVWCNTTNLQNDVMPSPSPRTMAPSPPSTHAHAPHLDPIAPYPTWNKHHLR